MYVDVRFTDLVGIANFRVWKVSEKRYPTYTREADFGGEMTDKMKAS